MVLWKKESVNRGGSYVNLMEIGEIDGILLKRVLAKHGISNLEKNDDKATEFRQNGNQKFKANGLHEAMELYNRSLQFATEKSENISLAYANRSACFLRMELYNECLVDIELAKRANYPPQLMPKLNEREKTCLKLMKDGKGQTEKMTPKLSFDPDEKYPCLANVLEIKNNEQFGKHIVAKRDIEVGQIVLIEESLVFEETHSDDTFSAYCKTCAKFSKNFIPCPNCPDVMFCDIKCMEANKIHEIACGVPYKLQTAVAETILIAVTAFSSADDLIKFVERALADRDIMDSPECNSTIQSKYRLFLKLFVPSNQMKQSQLSILFLVLLQIPIMKQRFNTQSMKRFLMHLILQHILIIEANRYDGYSMNTMGSFKEGPSRTTHIFSSLFNHSCFPNVSIIRSGNQNIAFIVRPVKKGEQLFTRYILDVELSTKERQSILRTKYKFECKCDKCVPRYKQEDLLRMRSDPNYYLIFQSNAVDFEVARTVFKATCCEFLSKYGRLPWSEEIEKVLCRYTQCLMLGMLEYS